MSTLLTLLMLIATPVKSPVEHFLSYHEHYGNSVSEIYVLHVDLNVERGDGDEVLITYPGFRMDSQGYAWMTYAPTTGGYEYLEECVPRFLPDCCFYIGIEPTSGRSGLFAVSHAGGGMTSIVRISMGEDRKERIELIRSVLNEDIDSGADVAFVQMFYELDIPTKVLQVKDFRVVEPGSDMSQKHAGEAERAQESPPPAVPNPVRPVEGVGEETESTDQSSDTPVPQSSDAAPSNASPVPTTPAETLDGHTVDAIPDNSANVNWTSFLIVAAAVVVLAVLIAAGVVSKRR